jgi:hypothetical protein
VCGTAGEYRELQPLNKTKGGPANLYDEVAACFAKTGVTVRDTKAAGVPTILLLCDELYDRPEVVNMIAMDMPAAPKTAGSGGRRASALGGARRASAMAARPAAVGGDARRASVMSGGPRRLSTLSSAQTALMSTGDGESVIPLFSTAHLLSWYFNRLPDRLKFTGVLGYKFDKWPSSQLLQEAAAESVARTLLGTSDTPSAPSKATKPATSAPPTEMFSKETTTSTRAPASAPVAPLPKGQPLPGKKDEPTKKDSPKAAIKNEPPKEAPVKKEPPKAAAKVEAAPEVKKAAPEVKAAPPAAAQEPPPPPSAAPEPPPPPSTATTVRRGVAADDRLDTFEAPAFPEAEPTTTQAEAEPEPPPTLRKSVMDMLSEQLETVMKTLSDSKRAEQESAPPILTASTQGGNTTQDQRPDDHLSA